MNYRVDVAGCPVVVKGEAARDHLETVNRERAQMRLENAKLRAELAALRGPAGDLVEVAGRILYEFHATEADEAWDSLDLISRAGVLNPIRAVLAAVLPRVWAEAIEQAARICDEYGEGRYPLSNRDDLWDDDAVHGPKIARAIRAMLPPPPEAAP